MKFLLIEDDEEKRGKIVEQIAIDFPEYKIDHARSFHSGLRILATSGGSYELMLLDMSMPNYDVTPSEPGGGTHDGFAGRDILAQMRLRGISVPTIVITQYDSFGAGANKRSLSQLSSELSNSFGGMFKSAIYYNSAQDSWRKELHSQISKVLSIK